MKASTTLALLLALALLFAACSGNSGASGNEAAPGSAPETPDASYPPEPAQKETSRKEPETIPTEDRVAAITPSRGDEIRERKAENENVAGWLTVPGTDVDSMIVQAPFEDNGFYTTHDFDGNPSEDGAYFADNRADFTAPTREGIPQNIALYGHNFDEDPDGRLFAQLKRFKDPAFAKAHPYVFFSTEAEDFAYEVFAVYDVTINQPFIIPDLPWSSLREILELAYAASIYDYGIRLTETDKLLTLATCSFTPPGREPLPLDSVTEYRFVVMARLVPPDETRKDAASIVVNNDPLIPDAMPVLYSHHTDLIQYGGTVYGLAGLMRDAMPEADPASLVPHGEVLRSGVMRDLVDFDATSLPVGTKLFRLPGYEAAFFVKIGDEIRVYEPY